VGYCPAIIAEVCGNYKKKNCPRNMPVQRMSQFEIVVFKLGPESDRKE
jgi:hypothetical protein